MVDPVLVYAEYPFVKDPAIKGVVPSTTQWRQWLDGVGIASLRGPGFNAYDPDAKSVAAYQRR